MIRALLYYMIVFVLFSNCISKTKNDRIEPIFDEGIPEDTNRVQDDSLKRIAVDNSQNKDSIHFVELLNNPLDIREFKKAKRSSNSGGFNKNSYLYKPHDVRGFFIHYFIFKGFGTIGPRIIAYRKGLDFGDFNEDRDTLVQVFSDMPDPDLSDLNLVGSSFNEIQDKFGQNYYKKDGFVIYYSGQNVLALNFSNGEKVRWFKWVKTNCLILEVDDIPIEVFDIKLR
jgi:hypothetical protein